MLEIMKASAGSGKTYNLARKYLTLLFRSEDRYAYRHILAVTFTNKATDEMKSRILKELYILSVSPEDSGYFIYFMPEKFPAGRTASIPEEDFIRKIPGYDKVTPEAIKAVARNVLYGILHDYGAFAVSTIDRFFQQALKAFSREIGQFASYQVELDKKSLVAESVDRVLDALTEDDRVLLEWLTDSAMEQIEKGGRYSLEKDLLDMASRLKSEQHRSLAESIGADESVIYSKEHLKKIRSVCGRAIKSFEEETRQAAQSVSDILVSSGVSASDFMRGFMKQIYNYTEPAPGARIESPTVSFLANASDHEKWFKKADRDRLLPMVYPALEEPLEHFCSLFADGYKVYNTACILKDQLYALGIAGDLYREFDALMKEKNVLSLDDSNTILKDIIDGSDAPFVYEKIGVRYEHFLLDEFQDTSHIQWENFKPLLQNSDAQGFDNLVVGDVKQSIYRWRGSDWNLLDSGLKNGFGTVSERTLDTNFRSLRNIIGFNNAFFPVAAALLDGRCGTPGNRSIADIYADVAQKVAAGEEPQGSVDISFCEPDAEPGKVLSIIRDVIGSQGASYKDIAVLVRTRTSGAEVASFLISNDIPVITDDSLNVKSSAVVRLLVSLLSNADNPSDLVTGFLAGSIGMSAPSGYHSLADLCEHLLRRLHDLYPDTFDNEILYIQSFMDELQDYVRTNGNSLHDFLGYWDEKSAYISSPSGDDAVRIITVHKSKGLDFPYVIFPYVEDVVLFRKEHKWCVPDLEGTALEEASGGMYDVTLSQGSESSLFDKDFKEENKLQHVDNINIMYVSMTRAAKGMHLVCSLPPKSLTDAMDKEKMPDFKDFAQIMYWFVMNHGLSLGMTRPSTDDGSLRFSYGKPYDFSAAGASEPGGVRGRRKPGTFLAPEPWVSGYPSWPLNPELSDQQSVGERGRLKFSADAADFFSDEGEAGIEASNRLKGIVLHDILSKTVVPSDLEAAVNEAVYSGEIDASQASCALEMLSRRIAGAAVRGWFPDDASAVRTEVTLIDTDGSIYRPDRVVETPEGIVIIDYKFGEHRRSYERQVARYADIYRRMGYSSVSTALWYVIPDKVL